MPWPWGAPGLRVLLSRGVPLRAIVLEKCLTCRALLNGKMVSGWIQGEIKGFILGAS